MKHWLDNYCLVVEVPMCRHSVDYLNINERKRVRAAF